MLLRASGQNENASYNINSITDSQLESGVKHAQHLRALTEAAISSDWLKLAEIRPQIESAIGRQQTVDTLVVASAFNGITRVADATGIPLDDNVALATVSLRNETGIQRFEYAEKSDRYG